MKYVEQYNIYIDEDLVIYGCWSSKKNKNPDLKLFQVPIYRNKRGYRSFRCKLKDGSWILGLVHRAVALAFIPNPQNKPTVDHINRNPSDNRICNLRWATQKEQVDNRGVVLNPKYGHALEDRAGYMRNYRKEHPEYVEKNKCMSKARYHRNKAK